MDTSNKSITNNSQHIAINTSPTVELVDDETVVMFTQNVTTFESRTTPVGDDGNEHFYQQLQNRFSETFLKVLKILHNVPSSDDPWFEGPHKEGNFHSWLEGKFKKRNWQLELQAPQGPYTNVLDLQLFPAMSKRHSTLLQLYSVRNPILVTIPI